jgi:hypothetical protein
MWQTKSESGEKLQENASKSINSIHSSEVIQGARKKNVELCIYVYEAFLDEVQIGHFHFWLRKSRPTFRLINSRKLENFHSIIEFIATDEGINEKTPNFSTRQLAKCKRDVCKKPGGVSESK